MKSIGPIDPLERILGYSCFPLPSVLIQSCKFRLGFIALPMKSRLLSPLSRVLEFSCAILVSGCPVLYAEIGTPIRSVPDQLVLEPGPPEDMLFMRFAKAWIPLRTRDGREWTGGAPDPYALVRVDGKELFADIWFSPKTGEEASRCPWLRKLPNKDIYTCRIHETKPLHCRNFPKSKKHALTTGCKGFGNDPTFEIAELNLEKRYTNSQKIEK